MPVTTAQLPADLAPDLAAAAVRVELHADAVRRRAVLIGRHSAIMRWDSSAGWIARDHLDELTTALLTWCRRAEGLAEQLRVQAAIARSS